MTYKLPLLFSLISFIGLSVYLYYDVKKKKEKENKKFEWIYDIPWIVPIITGFVVGLFTNMYVNSKCNLDNIIVKDIDMKELGNDISSVVHKSIVSFVDDTATIYPVPSINARIPKIIIGNTDKILTDLWIK